MLINYIPCLVSIAQCLLDWGYGGDNEPSISPPNRNLAVDKLMGVNIILLHQQTTMAKSSKLHKRLVQLENNKFIKPLLDDCDDPVLKDIQDIPRICANIQEDWQEVGMYFSRCISFLEFIVYISYLRPPPVFLQV